jgi:TrmH family RNA methyltransferase
MAKIRIYSENAAYQALDTLKKNRVKRHREGAFFVEGVRSIDAAARYGWRFRAFIYDGGAKLSRWARETLERNGAADMYELKSELMGKLSSKTDASELIAIVQMRDRAEASYMGADEANPVYVLFDRPSNRGNLGTTLRSCDAFGVRALYFTGHSADIYDPEVIASSTGSFFAVPFAQLPKSDDIDKTIDRLRAEHPGLLAVGTSARAGLNVYDANFHKPLLLMIGSEADGLSWRLRQMSDIMVSIPMREDAYASSLNVSCAVSVLLGEAFRRRGMQSL